MYIRRVLRTHEGVGVRNGSKYLQLAPHAKTDCVIVINDLYTSFFIQILPCNHFKLQATIHASTPFINMLLHAYVV